jgi:hypothetical protein
MVIQQLNQLTIELESYHKEVDNFGNEMFERLKSNKRTNPKAFFGALRKLGLNPTDSDEQIALTLKSVLSSLNITPCSVQIALKTTDLYSLYPSYYQVDQVVFAGNQDQFLHKPRFGFDSIKDKIRYFATKEGRCFYASDDLVHTSLPLMNYPIIEVGKSIVIIAQIIIVNDQKPELVTTPIRVKFKSCNEFDTKPDINRHPFDTSKMTGICEIEDPNTNTGPITATFDYSLKLQDMSNYPIQDWNMNWHLQFVI